MVEVYRTNVRDRSQADFLIKQFAEIFPAYHINFDLEDCDKILRVESAMDTIEVYQIIDRLNEFGFIAQVLPDICPEDIDALDSTVNQANQNMDYKW